MTFKLRKFCKTRPIKVENVIILNVGLSVNVLQISNSNNDVPLSQGPHFRKETLLDLACSILSYP